MPIHLLTEEVSSAIAAGEVIERPASVVKELLENALDAGAGSIEIEVEQGGKSRIAVVDDGHGIPAQEVELAIQRHSTSKLTSIQDLDSLQTLGFRGEALASIAAVSRLELVTRSENEPGGTAIQVVAGELVRSSAVGTAVGTAIQVKDLFFNVPARARFLKTDQTERGWISRLIGRYTLAYPDTRFRYVSEGRDRITSPGTGSPASTWSIHSLSLAPDVAVETRLRVAELEREIDAEA